jgi:hypothetical protein
MEKQLYHPIQVGNILPISENTKKKALNKLFNERKTLKGYRLKNGNKFYIFPQFLFFNCLNLFLAHPFLSVFFPDF